MPYRTSSSAGHHMACANSQSQPCQHMHNTPSRRFSAAGGVLYAVVLLTLCGFSPWPAHAKTFPRDKAALLDFYSTLSSPGDLKSSWSNTTDPCEDGWVGVLCDDQVCTTTGLGCQCAANKTQNATQPDRKGFQSVTGLFYGSLGSVRNGTLYNNISSLLMGKLSSSLGNLSTLRLLNLGGNLLSGTIPLALSGLPDLQQVVLSDNALRGELPPSLSDATSLALFDVANNVLNGSLPLQWCNSSFRASLSLEGNLGLCGYLPPCLAPRTLGIIDTGLISPANPQDAIFTQQIEACCNILRPACSPDDNCGVAVPLYWTNNTMAQFAFTPFKPPPGASANDLQYYWTWSTSNREPNQEAPRDGLYRRLNMSQAVVGPLNTNGSANYYTWLNSSGSTVKAPSNVSFFQFNIPFLDNYVLAEGVQYYVYVFGVNATCPNARSSAVSPPATVIVSPPTDGEVVVNNNQGTMAASDSISFVYRNFTDRFIDPALIQYNYTVSEMPADGSSVSHILAGPTNITGLANQLITVPNVALEPGRRYAVSVYATNPANKVGVASGQVLVESSSQGAVQLALGLSLGLVALFVLVTGLLVWFYLRRHKRRELARARERAQRKSLRTLLTGMSSEQFTKMNDFDDVLRTYTPMCFVVTDLENSTGMAAADKAAYTQLQQLHDVIVREYINKHSGYEINTEGDSFSIAFLDVQRAVLFCLDVQHRLLETNWPPEVLQLPTCKPITDAKHELMFCGPRVRMGIHYAPEMTVFCRKHPHTKQWEFRGPGFQVAKELGDAAHGGQVLLTDHAWVQLAPHMADAGFPVVYQLGMFRLPGLADAVFLYELQGLMGNALSRKYGPPRGVIKLAEGIGYDLGLPPSPRDPLGDPSLALVACRLVPSSLEVPLSEATFQLLRGKLDVCSSQYEGYMFHEDVRAWGGKQNTASMMDCRLFYAFSSVLDAVRFAHVSQMYLMADTWDACDVDCEAFGPTQQTPDGRLLFRGPRMAMVITWTAEYEEMEVGSACQDFRDPDVRFVGGGVDTLGILVSALHGGQVVLDAPAWEAVHEVLPLQCQALDLGVHYVWPPSGCDVPSQALEPMHLMEVMPGMLSYREFPPLRTFKQLQPGYRESPAPNQNMVIMFLRVVKPQEVINAQHCFRGVHEDDEVVEGETESAASISLATRALEHWHIAMSHVELKIRALLLEMDGYECKEPEPGKFTIAFGSLENAVVFSSAVQLELMQLDWDPAVLQWEECAPQTDSSGQLLWQGLRVKVGMVFGTPTLRKPLNTGRADYFGAVPNLAARVCSLARPGQSLLDVDNAVVAALDSMMEASKAQSSPSELGLLVDGLKLGAWGPHACSLRIWGRFGHPELKGVPGQRLIAAVQPLPLLERTFERPRQASKRLNSSETLGRIVFGPSDGSDPTTAAETGHVRFACSEKLPALTVLTAHYRQKHRQARLKRRLRRNKAAYGGASASSGRALMWGASTTAGTDTAVSETSDHEYTGANPTSRAPRSISSVSMSAQDALAAMSDSNPAGSGRHGVAPRDVAAVAQAVEGVVPANQLPHMPLMRLSVLSHQGGAAEVITDTAGESEEDAPFVQQRRRRGRQAATTTQLPSPFYAATTTNSSASPTPLGGSPTASIPQPPVQQQVVGLPSRELSGRCTRMWYDKLPGDLGMSMRERDGISSFVMASGEPMQGSDSSTDLPATNDTLSGSTKEMTSPFVLAPSRTSDGGSSQKQQSYSMSNKGSAGRKKSQAHEDIVRNAMLEARVTIEGQRQMSRSLSKRVSKATSGRTRPERVVGTAPAKAVAAMTKAQQQRRMPAHVGQATVERTKSDTQVTTTKEDDSTTRTGK